MKKAVADTPEAGRTVALLATENDRQMSLISRLEERISVMEWIATDTPAQREREIARLR